MLALGGFFEDDCFGAAIVRRDRGGEPRRPEPDHDDFGLDIPARGDCAHRLFPVPPGGPLSENSGSQPHLAWPPASVIVMWPIVVSALAPCQWRSPALMCATSPILISCGVPPSAATMPDPEVTTRIWSQVWVCQPVVQPWLKFTTLQL